MEEFVYCGRISPSNRIANKLRCIEPYITYEVLKEVEKLHLHLNLDSELGVDQLLALIERIYNVRFLFK